MKCGFARAGPTSVERHITIDIGEGQLATESGPAVQSAEISLRDVETRIAIGGTPFPLLLDQPPLCKRVMPSSKFDPGQSGAAQCWNNKKKKKTDDGPSRA
jgi:hypothetical protein